MTRKEIHDFAVQCRKRMEANWFNGNFTIPGYKLHAKCRGLVSGDRMECAIFHHDNKALHRRAFD